MTWTRWTTQAPPNDLRITIVRKGEPEPLGEYRAGDVKHRMDTSTLYWKPSSYQPDAPHQQPCHCVECQRDSLMKTHDMMAKIRRDNAELHAAVAARIKAMDRMLSPNPHAGPSCSTTHIDPPQSKASRAHDDAKWLEDGGWSGKR